MPRRVTAPSERLRRVLMRAKRRNRRVLLLGIGNEMLGDDAVGNLIARDLAAINTEVFHSVPVGVAMENAAHLVRRHDAEVLILVDAADGIGKSRWGFVPPSRLDSFCHSTHTVPLSLLVSVWQAENPDLEVHFIGVRPRSSGFADSLSDAVAASQTEIESVFRELFGPSAPGVRTRARGEKRQRTGREENPTKPRSSSRRRSRRASGPA